MLCDTPGTLPSEGAGFLGEWRPGVQQKSLFTARREEFPLAAERSA
jgi:hypothetical protein